MPTNLSTNLSAAKALLREVKAFRISLHASGLSTLIRNIDEMFPDAAVEKLNRINPHIHFMNCADCDALMSTYTSHTTQHGSHVCNSCREDDYFQCGNCGEVCHEDDRVHISDTGNVVCQSCADNHFHYDEDDGEYYSRSRRSNNTLMDYSTRVDRVLPSSSLFLSGRHLTPPVHDRFLNAKPGHRLHLGVELEVCAHDCDREDAVEKVIELAGKHAICKYDGSLDEEYGFEICTVPATLTWHTATWPEKLEAMRKFLRSFDDRKCGMHVHMSKSAFTRLQLGRFIAFFNDAANKDFLTQFAQRKFYENGYCSPIHDSRVTDENKTDKHFHGRSVNIAPKATVEVRIFKGTLHPESFVRNLEFVCAVREFCGKTSNERLKHTDFSRWMTVPENRALYPRVWRRLVAKGHVERPRVKTTITEHVVGPAPISQAAFLATAIELGNAEGE